MEKYPKRVFSKPEFTALPPFIFTGAEFALIPSRDEPFGLVAVEFGRKGALGVGARVGGLGQMPGWWFTVESTTTKHMLHQFKSAIEEALASDTETRAMMRARSAKQRFPVAKWVEDLNTLQQTAIKIHNEEKDSTSKGIFRPRSRASAPRSSLQFPDGGFFYPQSRAVSTDRLSTYEARPDEEHWPPQEPDDYHTTLQRGLSLGIRSGPGHRPRASLAPEPLVRVYEERSPPRTPEIHEIDPDGASLLSEVSSLHDQEILISREQAEANYRASERQLAMAELEGSTTDAMGQPLALMDTSYDNPRGRSRSRRPTGDEESLSRSRSRTGLLDPSRLPMRMMSSHHRRKRSSALDLSTIKNVSTSDFSLQKVDPTFEDKTGAYYAKFDSMLANLSGKTSESDLCIEEFLVESEKEWFKKLRAKKLGRSDRTRSRDSRLSPSPSPAWPRNSLHSNGSRDSSPSPYVPGQASESDDDISHLSDEMDEFLLGPNYHRPTLLKRWMQTRFGDWPIYSFLLALGQIMAANSYQITLLTGPQGQSPAKLYIIGAIFIVMSGVWWIMFRLLPSKFALSAPFAIYGAAFFFVGMAPFAKFGPPRDWMQNVATGLYVSASASGSIFFALNFGDEGEPTLHVAICRGHTDILRRCTDQVLDLPSLHDPRNSANLHHSTLLLGKHTHNFVCRERPHILTKSCNDHASDSRLDVHHWSSAGNILATLLSPISRPHSVSLQDTPQKEDRRLVCRHDNSAELLPQYAVWTQLGLPLVLSRSTTLGGRAPCAGFLRCHLGDIPFRLCQIEQQPFLGYAYFRHWTGRTEVGSNALGRLRNRKLGSLDAWRSRRRCSRWSQSLALARPSRFTAGSWLRYDALADPHQDSCRGVVGAGASPRHSRHYGRESYRSQCKWTR